MTRRAGKVAEVAGGGVVAPECTSLGRTQPPSALPLTGHKRAKIQADTN